VGVVYVQASSAALKLGGWAIPQHNRQPLRAAARGLSGSSIAKVAGGGRIQRHVADLARPQDTFPDPTDNSQAPWTPAKFPHLAARLAAAAAGGSSSSVVGVHPYGAELGSLQYKLWQLQRQQEAVAAAVGVDFDAVPCNLVDTAEGLEKMAQALQGVKQVAVDLEHHSYRWGKGAPQDGGGGGGSTPQGGGTVAVAEGLAQMVQALHGVIAGGNWSAAPFSWVDHCKLALYIRAGGGGWGVGGSYRWPSRSWLLTGYAACTPFWLLLCFIHRSGWWTLLVTGQLPSCPLFMSITDEVVPRSTFCCRHHSLLPSSLAGHLSSLGHIMLSCLQVLSRVHLFAAAVHTRLRLGG
jgi:hypothetical protein